MKFLSILQNMVEQDFVRHASGNPNLPFINGFYLYVLNVDFIEKGRTVRFLK